MKKSSPIEDRPAVVPPSADDRFSCWLPARIGVPTMFILRRLFAGIRIGAELKATIDALPDDAVIVYVSKSKSVFELLCGYIRYRQAGLPFPQLGFDSALRAWQPVGRLLSIAAAQLRCAMRHFAWRDPYHSGFIRHAIQQGTTALLPLTGKRDFYRRFVKSGTDPVGHLIDIQRSFERPICLVPQLLFFSKQPPSTDPTLADIFFGSAQKPGKWRRLTTLFNKPEKIFIEFSDPVDLQRFLSRPGHRHRSTEYLALKLRRDLLRQINAHRKSVTGPTIKMPEEIKQEILTAEELRQFMDAQARRRGISTLQAHREAVGYIDEIAANYSPAFISLVHRLVEHFMKTVFESVTFNGAALSRIRRVARQAPVVFVPAHKSHLDSLLLSFTLYDNRLPCPHVFAGRNLAFWPMGPLFRRVGAFFVRRSFKGAVFYAKVFSAYIFQLLKEGFNIAVYIEGTRSRSGKLLRPQLGMLSILLHACFNGACSDMIFVPTFIAYDRIPDEGAYLHETSGGKKAPENFRQLLKAKALLKNRYGSVHLNFGEPLALQAVLSDEGLNGTRLSSKQQNRLCRTIGARLMNAIDRQTVVTPQSLVAGALLSGGREIVSAEALDFRVEASLKWLTTQRTPLADSLEQDPTSAVDRALNHYRARKFIQGNADDGRPSSWRMIEDRRNALDYYKNISICHFIPAAFTALAILEKDAFQFSAADLHDAYRSLQDLFAEEFNPDPFHPPAYVVRKTVKAFIDSAILVPHPVMPDTYNLSSGGFRRLSFFAGFVLPFLESYRSALVYFAKNRRNHHPRPKMLKRMLAIGRRMLRQGEIRLKESISKANYANAADFFIQHGVRGSEDEVVIRQWDRTLGHYLDLIYR